MMNSLGSLKSENIDVPIIMTENLQKGLLSKFFWTTLYSPLNVSDIANFPEHMGAVQELQNLMQIFHFIAID